MRTTSTARVLVCFLAVSLAACGGGSSGGDGVSTRTVDGKVTDPAIALASVRLEGADGGALAAVRQTDDNGVFRFTLSAGTDLEGARVHASGGRDLATGYDFRGIQLIGPVLTGDDVIVSPLTTLVVEEMDSMAVDVQTAAANLAARLGIDAGAMLADPTDSAPAQLAALKLTRIAHVLRDAGDPMPRLAGTLRDQGSLGDALHALQIDSALPQSVRDRLIALEEEMAALDAVDVSGAAAAVVAAANRIAWHRGLLRYLEDALSITPGDAETEGNIEALAVALWQANGERGVPADAAAVRNVARYAFQQFDIDPDSLDQPAFSVPGGLSGDSNIPGIAALDVIDHRVPLAEGEQPGFDNDARLQYFYSSTLSPFYRAEQLFADVFDDNVLDPVYVDITAGLAAVGQLERANVVLRANIFQPTQRANAQRLIGRSLANRGLVDDAVTLWEEALSTYDATVLAQGLENLDADDASFYQTLSGYYLDVGMTGEAEQVFGLVEQYLADNEGEPYTTTYGRILTGVRKLVDAQVSEAEADGVITAAEQTQLKNSIDLYRDFVDGTGYQTSGSCQPHYKLKTFYITGVADFYLRAGLTADAEAATELFETYRLDECNRSETEVYPRFIAPVYAELGLASEFQTMVENTVDSSFWQDYALQELNGYFAYQDAIAGDVSTALSDIEAQNTDLDDRLEAMTFGGVNRRDEELAMKLLNDGYTAEALEVMDAAWTLATSQEYLDEFGDDARDLVDYGCAKLAALYYDFDSVSEGRDRMDSCQTIADQQIDASDDLDERISARIYLAEGHSAVGQQAEVLSNINAGQSLIPLATDTLDANGYRRLLAQTAAINDLFYVSLDLLGAAVDDYDVFAGGASDDDAREDAINDAKATAGALLQLVDAIQQRALETGSLSVQEQAHVTEARGLVVSLMAGGDAEVANGAVSLAEVLADPDEVTDQYEAVVERFAAARAYDQAEAVARRPETPVPARNEMLQLIAQTITREHDFGGETVLASRDLDGDGQPDFFDLSADPDDISASPLTMDMDIDGDGLSDDQDRTPFCADCGD